MKVGDKRPGNVPPSAAESAKANDKKPIAAQKGVAAPKGLDAAMLANDAPKPAGPQAAAASDVVAAAPLSDKQLGVLKSEVGRLTATVSAPPTGEIAKSFTLRLTDSKSFAPLSLVLSPEQFAEVAVLGNEAKVFAGNAKKELQGDVIHELIKGEAKAASLFMQKLPPQVQGHVSAMAKVLSPAMAEAARMARATSASSAKRDTGVVDVSLSAGATKELEGHLDSLTSLLGSADIESLMFLVMAEMAHDAAGDLADMLKEVQANNKKKKELREHRDQLKQWKAGVEQAKGRLDDDLHTRYDERTRIKDKNDPSYIDPEKVSFEMFVAEQPVRVLRGSLENPPDAPVLAPSPSETLYNLPGEAGRMQASSSASRLVIGAKAKRDPEIALKAAEALEAMNANNAVQPPLTATQQSLVDDYGLSKQDARAVDALYTAYKTTHSQATLEDFAKSLELASLKAPKPKGSNDPFSSNKPPAPPDPEEVKSKNAVIIASYMCSQLYGPSPSPIAMGYPGTFADPPTGPSKLSPLAHAMQIMNGIGDEAMLKLQAVFDAFPAPKPNDITDFMGNLGFDTSLRVPNKNRPWEKNTYFPSAGDAAAKAMLSGWAEALGNPAKLQEGTHLALGEEATRISSTPPGNTSNGYLWQVGVSTLNKIPSATLRGNLLRDLEAYKRDRNEQTMAALNRAIAACGPYAGAAKAYVTLTLNNPFETMKSEYTNQYHYHLEDYPLSAEVTWNSNAWLLDPGVAAAIRGVTQQPANGEPVVLTILPMTPMIIGTATAVPMNLTPAKEGDTPTTDEPAADDPNPDPPKAPPKEPPRVKRVAVPSGDEVAVRNIADALKNAELAIEKVQTDMDTLGDLSQEMQLRVQRYSERRLKCFDMISNLMKKAAETSGQIVQNLK